MLLENFWKNHENLYYVVKNKKVMIGISIVVFMFLLAVIGPMLTSYDYDEFVSNGFQAPSADHWFGTTFMGKDVFTRVTLGLRTSLLVGLIAGVISTFVGCIIGFLAGYYGGVIDEILMAMTNIFIVIPSLALLIIISAYLPGDRGILIMSLIISVTAWPWTARAVRSQTLAIRSQDYVNLSRISSISVLQIIKEDIAANMLSYVFMVFILQFKGAILAAVGLEFLGLGPTQGISLGLVLQNALNWNAIQLGIWWWAILPGLILTIFVTALYFINTGLDEVFNPRLREM